MASAHEEEEVGAALVMLFFLISNAKEVML
jgi:hypothetical protein